MKHFALMFAVMLCAQARSAAAYESVGCRELDDNSCWHAVNKSAGPVQLECSGYGRDDLFVASPLAQEEVYAYQFGMDWADGLGYFEPGVSIHCQVALQDGRSTLLHFKLKDYGDRVALSIDDTQITAVVRAFWTADMQVTHAPL